MSSINITEHKKKNLEKRVFSLEKIALAIHCGNMISSIRNKYIDPLILRHKILLPKINPRKIFKSKQPNEQYHSNKILFHKLSNQRQFTEFEEEKGIQTKDKISKEILPKIKSRNESLKNMNEKYFDTLLFDSGIFNEKDYYQKNLQKVKLSNIINLKSKDPLEYQNIYPRIENINKLNEKYNLNLDLTHLNNKVNTIKKSRRMSIKGLLNCLYNKYATASPTGIYTDNMNNNNKIKKKHKIRRKSQLSLITSNSQNDNSDSENNANSIDILKKNFISEDNSNTFITKLNIPKKETLNVAENIKKIKKLKNKIKFERNNNIINHDQKITIDCLRSNYDSKIQQKKLLYKYIDKTTFELQDEPLYKKVKKFESLIDKIIKKHN